MEFDRDLFAIQRLLQGVQESVGELKAIKYRGGNESKITTAGDSFTEFFKANSFFCGKKSTDDEETELRKITLYLILNTDFVHSAKLRENENWCPFFDTAPKLSKCLLANITWSVNICVFYCEAIYSLPLEISVELVEAAIDCLKYSDPYTKLNEINMLEYAIYVKTLKTSVEKIEENVLDSLLSKLFENFVKILKNYITPDTSQMTEWSTTERYKFLGTAIFRILGLVKQCQKCKRNEGKNVPISQIFISNIPDSAMTTEKKDRIQQALIRYDQCLYSACKANVMGVTVDVFCAWAEFKQNNTSLQQKIGNLAFDVSEITNGDRNAKELRQVLKAVAVKPENIEDIIRNADYATILENSLIENEHQKLWVKNLVRTTQIFCDNETFCKFKNIAHLCDIDDYEYLLRNLYEFGDRTEEQVTFIVELSEKFSEEELQFVLSQLYADFLLESNCFELESFSNSLTHTFNRITANETPNFKSIYIVMLQNPSKVIDYIYTESVKSTEQSIKMVEILCKLKMVLSDSCRSLLRLNFLLKQCETNSVTEKNVRCFLNELNNSGFVSTDTIVHELEVFILDTQREEIKIDKLTLAVSLLKDFINEEHFEFNPDVLDITKTFALIMLNYRWNFSSFNFKYVELLSELLPVLKMYVEHTVTMGTIKAMDWNEFVQSQNIVCPLKKYYLDQASINEDLYSSLFSDVINRNEMILKLMKWLSRCVPFEWDIICSRLVQLNGAQYTLNLLIDSLLILSDIAKTSSEGATLSCTEYCWQRFLCILKSIIFPSLSSTDEEKIAIKAICEMIQHLPPSVQQCCDLLLNIFNVETLRELSSDEEFSASLATFQELQFHSLLCARMQCVQ